MRSLTFVIDGEVNTQIKITELDDGTLLFELTVLGDTGSIGDLRALFFDIADDALIGGLTVVGDDVTDSRFSTASVDTLGQDANIKGETIKDIGKFDIGVELGTPGMSTDDIQYTSFILDHQTQDLTLDLIGLQDFGVRMTSVGAAGGARSGSMKVAGRSTAAPDAIDDTFETTEDAALTGVNVLSNDTDADGDTLVVSAVEGDPALVGNAFDVTTGNGRTGRVTLLATGELVFDPAGGFESLANGEADSFTLAYSVDDQNGGADTASVTVTITGVNDAPVIGLADLTGSVTEIADNGPGETVDNLTALGAIAFSDVDVSDTHTAIFDPQGVGYLGTFTLTDPTTTATTTNGTVGWRFTVNDGELDGLAQGEEIVQRYDVAIADPHGGQDGETVTVTLRGVNDAPVIDTAGSILEGGVTEIADEAPGEGISKLSALGAIAFSDVDVSDTHTARFDPREGGYLGSFTLGAPTTTNGSTDGSVHWDFEIVDADLDGLAEGQQVTQLYDVEIADPHGGVGRETVTVTLTGANDAPETGDVALSVNEDGPPETGVFQGEDVDSDDDRGSLAYTILSTPPAGVLDSIGDSFIFDPDGAFEDLASGESRSVGFTYKATDRHGADSNVSNGSITVNGANDRPIAQNVTASVGEDLLGVTAAFIASDIDATDLLRYEIVSGPAKGSVINNGDGTFTYSPFDDPNDFYGDPSTPNNRFQYLNAGESEQVTFTYEAIDDSGAANATSMPQTATITVTGDYDAPLRIGQQLTFQSNGQSIWSTGESFSFQSLEFFGGSWNVSETATLIEAVTLIEETEICIPFTNICTTFPEVGIPSLGVEASTSGTVGLLSDFQIDSGTIDSTLLVDAAVTVPFQAAEGQIVTIGTSRLLDALSDFSITTPAISYTLSLVFDVAASLSTFAGDAVTPLIDFAESSVTPLLEFLPGDATIEFPDVTGGLIDATVSAPDLDTTGTVTGPNVLGSFEEDPFFTVGFDLDGLATTLAGIPGLEDDKTEQTGPFAVTLGYNLLDLTLQTALTVTQSFDLTAEDFLFDITRDDTNEVVASDVSAGDSFVFTVPTGVGDALSFSAGVDPVATLNNQTGLGIDVDFLIDALSASFGFSAEFAGIEFDIVDLEFGPVYQDSVDVFDAQLATIFDDTFPLVGFQEQTFGFDLFVA